MVSTNNGLPIIDEASNESLSMDTLSQEETRKILTPFAFEIDKSLFGIPLASPTKRALAIAIDLFFIALLSETPGEILALVIAMTLYRLGSKKQALKSGKNKAKKRRKALRAFAVFIVFIMLLQLLPRIFSPSFVEPAALPNDTEDIIMSELSTSEAITFSALSGALLLTVNNSACAELACWKKELSPLVKPFSSFNLKEKVINAGIEEIVEATDLEKIKKNQLTGHLTKVYLKASRQTVMDEGLIGNVNAANPEEQGDHNLRKSLVNESVKALAPTEEKPPVYSIMEWLKGIIEDLGLGFGWAAFYFTVFTAVWHGQTPGKKALGIRVFQLDGTPLSMWDSFGRYGGYGAGLATGLLGFIQVFWNANRQAIQDQISATVVIDDRKRKIKS